MAILGLHETLVEGVAGIAAAVSLILKGDLGAAVLSLLLAGKLVAIFLILYTLMYFAGVVSLFKQKEHHWFARMIAVGFAILGLLNADIVDLILGIFAAAGTLIILIGAFALVMGGWYAYRKSKLKNSAESHQLKSAEIQRKRATDAQKHEHNIEKRAMSVEQGNLARVDGGFKKLLEEDKDTIRVIDNMITLLSHIDAVGTDSKSRDKYQTQLSKAMTRFTALLSQEYKELEVLEQQVISIEKTDIRTVHIGSETENARKTALRKFLEDTIGSRIETDKTAAQKNNMIKNLLFSEAEKLSTLEIGAVELDNRRIILEKKIIAYIESIKGNYTTQVLQLKTQLVNALHSGEHPAAINILHKLKEDLKRISGADDAISGYLEDIGTFARQRAELEDLFDEIVNGLTSKKMLKRISNGEFDKVIKTAKKVDTKENKAKSKEDKVLKVELVNKKKEKKDSKDFQSQQPRT